MSKVELKFDTECFEDGFSFSDVIPMETVNTRYEQLLVNWRKFHQKAHVPNYARNKLIHTYLNE